MLVVLLILSPLFQLKDQDAYYHSQMYLLREAVQRHESQNTEDTRMSSMGSTPCRRRPKMLWKFVADYIDRNGGSYRFGNATCKKKWEDLQSEGIEDES